MPANPSKDHVTRGLTKLIARYRKPRYQALATCYLARIQEIEDAIWEIIDGRNLADAVGKQLDILGTIVGRGRNDLSDDLYRLTIRTQIRINRSQGLSRDLTDVLNLSVSEDTPKAYYESAIATAHVIIGPGTYDIPTLRLNLGTTKALGVKLYLIVWYEPAFEFSSTSGGVPEDSYDHGFGSVSDTDMGGKFSHVEVI